MAESVGEIQFVTAQPNKRLERTRHNGSSIRSNLGEPLKRSVGRSLVAAMMKTCVTKIVFAFSMFLPFTISLTQQAPLSDVAPFDRYGRIRWDDEKKKLDKFADQLKNQPEMIGYIYIREAQISCEGYAVAHAIELTKYLIQHHHLPWNRIAWRDLGYGDGYEVSFWLFPAGLPPQYQPPYQGESVNVEDCGSLIRRSRAAANKRLERTRR